jgi:hypothetical protein
MPPKRGDAGRGPPSLGISAADIAAAERAVAEARGETQRLRLELERSRASVAEALRSAEAQEARARASAEEADRQSAQMRARSWAAAEAEEAASASASASAPSSSSSSSPSPQPPVEHDPHGERQRVRVCFGVRLTGCEGQWPARGRVLVGLETAPLPVQTAREAAAAVGAPWRRDEDGDDTVLYARAPGENDFVGLYPSGLPRTFENAQARHLAVEYTDGRARGEVGLGLPSVDAAAKACAGAGAGGGKADVGPPTLEVWYVHESGTVVSVAGGLRVVAPAAAGRGSGSGSGTPTSSGPSNAGASGVSSFSSSATAEDDAAVVASSSSRLAGVGVAATAPPTPPPPPQRVGLASPSSLPRRVFRPPFLLEKHVRISTYQLTIPLPKYVRSSAPSAPGEPAAAAAVVVLPDKWRPGVSIEGDTALNATAGPPTVEVVFELPRLGRPMQDGAAGAAVTTPAPASSAYDATAAEAAAAASLSPSALAALPRDLFRIRLRLAHRIEAAKSTLRVESDHVILRLPLYYGGSALSDRPPSLITAGETLSLRRQGRRLACRECGGILVRTAAEAVGLEVEGGGKAGRGGGGGAAPSSSSPPPSPSPSPSPTAMRAYVLPSEYWLEWSDYWMCHEGQANIFIPDKDFGALRGTFLMGETHLQVHPLDVRPEAILIRPDRAELAAMRSTSRVHGGPGAGGSGGGGGGLSSSPAPSTPAAPTFDDAVPCLLTCARCTAPLGSARFVVPPEAGDVEGGITLLPTTGSSGLPSLARDEAGLGLDDKLSPEADPVLRLFKDRLSVPTDAGREPVVGGVAAGTAALLVVPAPRTNALSRYGVCARLATDLLSAATARSHFQFLVLATDADAAEGEEGEAGSLTPAQRLYSRVRLLITVVNWNSSVRGSTTHVQEVEEEAVGGGGGGGGKGAAGARAGAGAGPGAGGRWDHERDQPALQVRYRPVYQPLSREEAAEVEEWEAGSRGGGAGAALALPLLEDECDEVVAALAASTALLPASGRAHAGMLLGYLPFWERG